MELRGDSQANLDLYLLQETNIMGEFYTCGSNGYIVIVIDALSRHRGGVAEFYREYPQFMIKDIQKFRKKVVSFQLAIGERRGHIIGCKLASDNALMIESSVTAFRDHPQGDELLVTEDFNADLKNMKGAEWDEDIAVDLVEVSLEHMLSHFLLKRRPWCQDRRT